MMQWSYVVIRGHGAPQYPRKLGHVCVCFFFPCIFPLGPKHCLHRFWNVGGTVVPRVLDVKVLGVEDVKGSKGSGGLLFNGAWLLGTPPYAGTGSTVFIQLSRSVGTPVNRQLEN